MNVTIRQIIVGSIPTLAAILGFLWFRRKRKNPAITSKDEVSDKQKASVKPVLNDVKSKTPEPSPVEEIEVVQQAVVANLTSQKPAINEKDEDKSSSPSISSYDLESQIWPSDSMITNSTPEPVSISCEPASLLSKSLPVEEFKSSQSLRAEESLPAEEFSSSQPSHAEDQQSEVSEIKPQEESKVEEIIENGLDPSSHTADTEESNDDDEDEDTVNEDLAISSSDNTENSQSSQAEQHTDLLSTEVTESLCTAPEKDTEVAALPEEEPEPIRKKSADENANLESVASRVEEVEEESSSNTNSGEVAVCSSHSMSDGTSGLTNGEVLVNGDVDRLQKGSGEGTRDKSKTEEQNHTPAGDCDHANSDAQSEVSSDSGRGASGIETPTATSPNELNEYMVYEFDFPTEACGRLIGRAGKNINSLKAQTGTEIVLKRKPGIRDFQTCSIEGAQSQVRAAIDLIKARFPSKQYRDITYEQTNTLDESPMLTPQVMQLSLPEGVSLDVIVSSVVDANHIFVQQVTHPTFPSLEKLGQCMAMCYTHDEVPELPRPIETGMICAAPMYAGWYRAMVTETYPDTDEVEIKYIDYGGYMRVGAALLRQIRTDFMGLPFQATECFLANVMPLTDQEGFGVEASGLLESLVQGILLQAQIVGRLENGTPYIELYSTSGPQPVFVNRELVNMGVARWFEMTA